MPPNGLPAARLFDAVTTTGARLTPLLGQPIAKLGLFAVGAHGLAPIPFQIDEREGREAGDAAWIYTLGPYAHPDADEGALDSNDELVFMARDTGARASASPARARTTLELEVRDPVTGDVAYVYLASFDETPPRNPQSYVRLDAQTDTVSATNYFASVSTAVPVSWSNFTLRDARGRPTANLLDRFKVRVRALFVLGLVEWKVNEEELQSVPVGYRDGPVRVIRRVRNRLETGLGLERSDYLLDTVYYDNAVFLPAFVVVPFEPGFFMKDIAIRTSVDFRRALEGWTFTSSRNQTPVTIDGVMSPAERTLDRGDTDWIVLSKDDTALISRVLVLDARLKNVRRGLYYVDDANVADAPEGEPGQTPNVGFEFSHFEGATAGSYKTLGEIYMVNGYERGMEQPFLDLRSKPLLVTATLLP